MVTDQVKGNLCFGLYGRTPVQIDPEIQKKALIGYQRGSQPITCKPAQILEPELERARKRLKYLKILKT